MELRCKQTPVLSERPDRGIESVDTFEIVQPPTQEYKDNVDKYYSSLRKEYKELNDVVCFCIKNYDKINECENEVWPPIIYYNTDMYKEVYSKMQDVQENFMKIGDFIRDVFYSEKLTNYTKRNMINNKIREIRYKTRVLKTNTYNNKYILNVHIEHVYDELDDFNIKEIKNKNLFDLEIETHDCICDEIENTLKMVRISDTPTKCLWCKNKQNKIHEEIMNTPIVVPAEQIYTKCYVKHEKTKIDKITELRKRMYKEKKPNWLRKFTIEY